MEGATFHPCPRSRAQFIPVPSVAIPALPFSPLKFSGLMERVLADDIREIFPRLSPSPLKLDNVFLLIVKGVGNRE
jgi:hypothetical protein